ncbi:MAG: DUF58 domain-containing protein [Thermaurantimonas sp.]
MDTRDLIKKVRQIEIKTKKLSNDVLTGSYHSAFKGKGLTFSEVRPYAYGDEVRMIDWKVTARLSTPHVKMMEEERELTILLIIDRSASLFYGTRIAEKADYVTEIAALLTFSALKNNDKVGLITASGSIDKVIPPAKGRYHALKIIRELVNEHVSTQGSSLAEALDYVNKVFKKRSVIFILSDFLFDEEIHKQVRQLCSKHDVTAIRILDRIEKQPVSVGYLKVTEVESGRNYWINLDKQLIDEYTAYLKKKNLNIKNLFKKYGGGFIELETGDDYFSSILKYFSSK